MSDLRFSTVPGATITIDQILAGLRALDDRHKYRAVDYFEPYDKQALFFKAGAQYRERLLMAGNQLGKTFAGAAEVAYHLTGEYPWWWEGRRFDHAVSAWCAGETSILVRDGPQKLLCGQPGVEEAFGTGLIPRDCFVDKPSLSRGVTDAYDTIQVRHSSGGISTLTFKSYEQGREKFQSATLDFVWLDEEPDITIYSECLTRITATRGFVFMTFTPLKGMSDVVSRYLNEPSLDRNVTTMVIEDAKHIPPEERQKIINGYPAHEREARSRGIPMLGSGRVFQIPEDTIREPAIDRVPTVWAKGWGLDFGIGHPFAAVLAAWDRDADVLHILDAFKMADSNPALQSQRIKNVCINASVFWPHDGNQREKSGDQVASLYRVEGLKMWSEHATFPEGGYSTEVGVAMMDKMMREGRWKVAEHLSQWFEEYRLYHRKDGMIVKERDDLLSASRIAMMMRRHFKLVALGSQLRQQRRQQFARDIDFDVFA